MIRLIFIVCLVSVFASAYETVAYRGDVLSLKISKQNHNRLVFEANIIKVVTSEEKGLQHEFIDNQLFVKFSPFIKQELIANRQEASQKQPSPGDSVVYHAKPTDITIVTADNSYSLTLIPQDTPTKVYIISDRTQPNKKIAAYEADVDHFNLMKKLIFDGFNSLLPNRGYKWQADSKTILNDKKRKIVYEGAFIGERFEVLRYRVEAKQEQSLSPKAFIGISNGKSELASALQDTMLLGGESTIYLLVVSR
jgi:hypothetical protein